MSERLTTAYAFEMIITKAISLLFRPVTVSGYGYVRKGFVALSGVPWGQVLGVPNIKVSMPFDVEFRGEVVAQLCLVNLGDKVWVYCPDEALGVMKLVTSMSKKLQGWKDDKDNFVKCVILEYEKPENIARMEQVLADQVHEAEQQELVDTKEEETPIGDADSDF